MMVRDILDRGGMMITRTKLWEVCCRCEVPCKCDPEYEWEWLREKGEFACGTLNRELSEELKKSRGNE